MAENPWTDMKIDMGRFIRNRNAVPPEYLIPFMGRYIAWHADGTHVVAAAEEPRDLHERVKELGFAQDEVVVGYVDEADSSVG